MFAHGADKLTRGGAGGRAARSWVTDGRPPSTPNGNPTRREGGGGTPLRNPDVSDSSHRSRAHRTAEAGRLERHVRQLDRSLSELSHAVRPRRNRPASD